MSIITVEAGARSSFPCVKAFKAIAIAVKATARFKMKEAVVMVSRGFLTCTRRPFVFQIIHVILLTALTDVCGVTKDLCSTPSVSAYRVHLYFIYSLSNIQGYLQPNNGCIHYDRPNGKLSVR